jgi:integrase
VPEYRLVKLRGKFAVAVHDDAGKRIHRFSLGTADKRDAERELRAFQERASKPKHITVAYLWQQYRDDKAARRITANMEYSGKAVLPFFGNLLPDDITDTTCRDYIAKRAAAKRKPGTIWTELNHLQIVLNWAHKKRKIPHQVAIERPVKPEPRDRRLTWQEGKKLLDAAALPHVKLAIALMLGTGARAGAILDLTWDRVDFERNQIRYADPSTGERRKGRATVPMTQDLRTRLSEARKGSISEYVIEWGGKPVRSVKKGFAQAVAKAGLSDVTPHVLRHTAATWMAEAGAPMSEIAAVLGHSDSRTTEAIYAKYTPGHLAKTVSALEMSGERFGASVPDGENKT